MLRTFFVRLSENRSLRNFAEQSAVGRRVSGRFVAGNEISDAVRVKLEASRVTRLATLDAKRGPHIVPVCFAYDGKVFYTAIDQKPKRVAPERLARVRNIKAEPRVALLINEYAENWTQLWYILVRGKAKLIPNSLSLANAPEPFASFERNIRSMRTT